MCDLLLVKLKKKDKFIPETAIFQLDQYFKFKERTVVSLFSVYSTGELIAEHLKAITRHRVFGAIIMAQPSFNNGVPQWAGCRTSFPLRSFPSSLFLHLSHPGRTIKPIHPIQAT